MTLHTNKTLSVSALNKTQVKEAGFTLTELLVALVLSLFMITAVIQSFLMTKRTYRTTDQINRIQENSRFATHFMTVALREAGNRGCIDEIRSMLTDSSAFNLGTPVIGWEFTGTNAVDTYALPADLDPDTNFSASNWTQGGLVPLTLPTVFDDELVNGSDLFIVNRLAALPDIVIKAPNPISNANLNTEDTHEIDNGQILIVADCGGNSADMFQHKNNPNARNLNYADGNQYVPGNKNLTNNVWSTNWGPDASIYALETVAFYIGYNSADIPALYRYDLGSGFGIGAPVELVEGVENMQVVYGEDTDSNNIADRYVSANQVSDWEDVITVRVSILVRSLENATDAAQSGNSFLLGENITINPTDDNLLRYVVTSTVKLRNRGLSNSLNVCEAEADVTLEACNF